MNRRQFLSVSAVAAAAPVFAAVPEPLRGKPKRHGYILLFGNGKTVRAIPPDDYVRRWQNSRLPARLQSMSFLPVRASLLAYHIIDLDTGKVIKDRFGDFTPWTQKQRQTAITACEKCFVEVVETKERWEEIVAEVQANQNTIKWEDLHISSEVFA